MTFDTAESELRRIMGLLEDNPEYAYRLAVIATYDEDGAVIEDGYCVGVGWYAWVNGKEYGNAIGVADPGASVDALRRTIHINYRHAMANL